MSPFFLQCFKRVLALGITLAVLGCGTTKSGDTSLQAPNVVPISPRLITSGQPTVQSLERLADLGFAAVIYLAADSFPSTVPGEAHIVRRQGLEYVEIPLRLSSPTEADYAAFASAMGRFNARKVLVHCQANMLASSMTFLYRVIHVRDQPELAYEAVARIWSPQGPWKDFMASTLTTYGVAFQPY